MFFARRTGSGSCVRGHSTPSPSNDQLIVDVIYLVFSPKSCT